MSESDPSAGPSQAADRLTELQVYSTHLFIVCSVSDPHTFYANPDTAFFLTNGDPELGKSRQFLLKVKFYFMFSINKVTFNQFYKSHCLKYAFTAKLDYLFMLYYLYLLRFFLNLIWLSSSWIRIQGPFESLPFNKILQNLSNFSDVFTSKIEFVSPYNTLTFFLLYASKLNCS
jgi:hypothetical protein